LPLKYVGYSTCYRKEAGKHGKDAWGVFRVHQFEKIEQFHVTEPEKSWEAFEEMISNSEEFYKSLGVPYQVVEIVSGAFNNSAGKKYDLEALFPYGEGNGPNGKGRFMELVSCSNCTDYQARELDIRYGAKTQTETRKKYVHLLNCTLTATERTLCCLLENFQTEDGFVVPKPLRKFLLDENLEQIEFIPYAKELPKEKDSTTQQAKGKVEKVAEKVEDLKV
jgi:seryl-tRNA synthetase